MSRIDEALRQAGLKTPAIDGAEAAAVSALEDFQIGPSATQATPAAIPEPRPRQALTSARAAVAPAFSERLVVHEDADPAAIEQYRRVAAVLHQAQVDRGIKVVMVASAQVAEGKTLTAANLGLTLSESYRRRVLLIDADLRRPALSGLFQVTNNAGLSEGLKAPEGHQLQFVRITESLALLPGGRPDPDPMSGLTSGRMQQVLEEAAAGFDWVILDTPPVSLLSDTPLLAAMVDAAVMVIDAGHSPCATVQRAIENIGRDKVIGIVLNRVDSEQIKASRYYEYYYRDEGSQGKPGSSMSRSLAARTHLVSPTAETGR